MEEILHAIACREYGTNVVGGVAPGKGGAKLDGFSLFDSVSEAVRATGANVSVVFVPPPGAADAIMEAADAGVPLDPAGAEVTVTAGDLRTTRILLLGSSFLSSEDPRLHFGLAGRAEVDSIEVLWPNGVRTRVGRTPADRVVEIACPARE